MSRDLDLLVAGDAVPDVIVGGVPEALTYHQVEQLVDSGTLTVGGSAAILACGAARLGLRVAFVGVVGDDAAGRFMLEELTARGVDTSAMVVSRDRATGLTVNLVRATDLDRAVITSMGSIADLEPHMLDPDLLRSARHLHVGSFYLLPKLAPGLAGIFAAAHEAGLTTSLDTQGDSTGRWEGSLRETLAATDLYFPNEDEAMAAAHVDDLTAALTVLAARGTMPVVKCGARGAMAYSGCRIVRANALPVEPVDTVGAGDTFDAGFLYGYLNGFPLERSLALGAACGSLSTRAAGGVLAQPSLAEALAALEGGHEPAAAPEREARR